MTSDAIGTLEVHRGDGTLVAVLQVRAVSFSTGHEVDLTPIVSPLDLIVAGSADMNQAINALRSENARVALTLSGVGGDVRIELIDPSMDPPAFVATESSPPGVAERLVFHSSAGTVTLVSPDGSADKDETEGPEGACWSDGKPC